MNLTSEQRLAIGCHVALWLPSGHALSPMAIGTCAATCVGAMNTSPPCRNRVEFCLHLYWSSMHGVSFFYYCPKCWRKPGPDGRSPYERALEIPPKRYLNGSPL